MLGESVHLQDAKYLAKRAKQGPEKAISDPRPFFDQLVTRPWVDRVVLGPHIYCPEVSGAADHYAGAQHSCAKSRDARTRLGAMGSSGH
jgi:hypothetical protein